MRQLLRVLAWVGVAAAFLAASAVQFHTEAERLARSRSIDEEHFDRVKLGMRLDEVEAVLGGPPGRFVSRRWAVVGAPRESGRVPEGRLHEEWWYGEQGLIQVDFTRQGTVGRTVFWQVHPTPVRPPNELARRGLRRLAEQVRDRLRLSGD
jgi:hypothetical protein